MKKVKPKWTPGPWRVEHRAEDEWWIMADDTLVAVVYADDAEAGQANANLISAAHGLREALQRLVETFEQIVPINLDQVDYGAYKRAVDALRKARGETNE